LANEVGSAPLTGIGEPVHRVQGGDVVDSVEVFEAAACWYGAVLGGVTDKPDGGPRGFGEVDEFGEVTIPDRGGFVDDQHGVAVQHWGAVPGGGEQQGDGVGDDPCIGGELAGGLTFDGGTDHPIAGVAPRRSGGAHRGRLAGPRPADRGLHPHWCTSE
jgi:hypothetical protein